MNSRLKPIPRMEEREFGFRFGKRFKRHYAFSSLLSLEKAIKEWRPSDCFVSVAYYEYEKPYLKMNWRGADLFFDLDHEENTRIALADAVTIYESLISDFGLSSLEIIFSGAKGYHVVAYDDVVHKLNSRDRREIVDFMCGRYGVETIDKQASCDVKRLRRVPGTVNSKSGRVCVIQKDKKR